MSDTQYEYYAPTTTTNCMIFLTNESAMVFTIGTNGPNVKHRVTSVKLKLARQGTLTGDFYVKIFATSGGKPTGAALTTITVLASTLGTSAAYREYSVTDLVIFNPATAYAIVVEYPGGGVSNYVKWFRTTGGYSGGAECDSTDSGSTWNIDTHDLAFYEYGLAIVAVVALQVSLDGSTITLERDDSSAIKIRQGATTVGIAVVDTGNAAASAIRIMYGATVKALKKFIP